LFISSKK